MKALFLDTSNIWLNLVTVHNIIRTIAVFHYQKLQRNRVLLMKGLLLATSIII